MAQLSIIIPASRDTAALEETLISVLTHRPADCEVVVPHAGTYDDPYGMADEIALLNCDAKADTSQLVADGIEASQGEIVHLLGPGGEVTSDWCSAALEMFERPQIGSVVPLLEDDSTAGQVAVGIARGFGGRRRELRCRAQDASSKKVARKLLGPVAAAAFYRRSTLDLIGGWPANIGSSSADFDVALSLREAGFETGVAEDCAIGSHAIQLERVGAFRRAREQERLFWRHDQSSAAIGLRPLIAALQCLSVGMPWAMLAAACGKLAAGGAKKSGAEHRRRIAAVADDLSQVLSAGEAPNDVHGPSAYRNAA